MQSLWAQGVANQDLSTASWMFPIYVSSASDPVKTFTCTKWGACTANGLTIHVPNGAMPEAQADGHIGIIDTALNREVDGWQCAVTSSNVNCSWGSTLAAALKQRFRCRAGIRDTAQELLNVDHHCGLRLKQ